MVISGPRSRLYTEKEMKELILKEREACVRKCLLHARYSDGSEFDRGYQNASRACGEDIKNRRNP